jgi:ankyrin repeat protein
MQHKSVGQLLTEAAMVGDLISVKKLIDGGVPPKSGLSQTALFYAVANDQTAVVEFLISKGTPVNFMLNTGVTLLEGPIVSENLPMIELLLDAGAIINKSDAFGVFPIQVAALLGNTEIAELFLDHGANINQRGDAKNGFIEEALPITVAAAEGHAEMVKFLIDHGSRIETFETVKNSANYDSEMDAYQPLTDAYITSALLNGILSKDPATINLLVDAGVDEKMGLSTLDYAIITDDAQTIDATLKADPNAVNQIDGIGLKPLLYALYLEKLDVMEKLIANGADIELGGYDIGLLASAAEENSVSAMQILLNHGAKVDDADREGWTALHDAADNHSVEAMKLLIAWDANPRLKTNEGETPFDMVKWYEDRGALTKILLHDVISSQADSIVGLDDGHANAPVKTSHEQTPVSVSVPVMPEVVHEPLAHV